MSQFATRVNDTTIRISTNLLKLGMFVCRLDRPWLGTPFLMQGFLIESTFELQTLKALCNEVFIDTDKSLINLKANKPKTTLFSKRPADAEMHFSPTIDRDLAKSGIRNALPAYSQTLKSLRSCFKSYTQNQLVNAAALERQVNNCLDAVIQDTSAMTWLSRVKSHSNYTSEHSMHVSLLAMVFAIHCGWTKEEARRAGLAGLLFDLGKTKIPRQILEKPAPLSESEWQLVNDHPKWGRYFLEKSGFHQDVINAAYYHHERPDGAGYPTKRVGSQTPYLARLIRILDAYDAMISYRPYAQQRTVFEATGVLYKGRESDFDANIVDQFIGMIGVYPIGTLVELSSGEIAVVIGQNNNARLLPKISIVRDRNKNPVNESVANLKDIRDDLGHPRITIKTMLHDGSYGVYMKDFTRQLLTQ